MTELLSEVERASFLSSAGYWARQARTDEVGKILTAESLTIWNISRDDVIYLSKKGIYTYEDYWLRSLACMLTWLYGIDAGNW